MKAVGIIAEYDPFHAGHAYHLGKAREESGADYVVVVMSPDFLQRGQPALIDKWVRARMALEAGADLVLELPVRSAVASAEFFAAGGVRLLDSLGCIDALSFGCESTDSFALLRRAAHFFAGEEPGEYRTLLREKLRLGVSFPKARAQAFARILTASGTDCGASEEEILSLLSQPNNILAIEYQKAILRQNSSMQILPVRRLGSYHAVPACVCLRAEPSDTADSPDAAHAQGSAFASASAIRAILGEHDMTLPAEWKAQLPPSSLALLETELQSRRYVLPEDLNVLLHRALLDNQDQLQEYVDIDEDLSNRIRRCLNQYTGFQQFAALVQSRQYTLSRIRRCLLFVLLGIRKTEGKSCCVRVLGFRKEAGPLLRHIAKNGAISLSTSLSFADLSQEDIRAAHLWEMLVVNRTKQPLRHERQRQIVIL